VNVAVTFFARVIVSVQGPVPAQAPLQPVKVAPVAGVAVSITAVLEGNAALQEAPQSMPAGLDFTVPLPLLETVIV
jgi:hypothetical protein